MPDDHQTRISRQQLGTNQSGRAFVLTTGRLKEMDSPGVTDWMTAAGTFAAALAAVFAAIYTKRAAEAGAKAATEAANQVAELRILRETRVALVFRVPEQLTGEDQVNYGRGEQTYRTGTPVYLDVWNIGGSTIMVMEVSVTVDGPSVNDDNNTLTPQILVEPGKMVSINVAYKVMRQLCPEGRGANLPTGKTAAKARFTVKYFSGDGERAVETDCTFLFWVTEDEIFTFTGDSGFGAKTGNYFPVLAK